MTNPIEHVKNVLWVKYPDLKEFAVDGTTDYSRMEALLVKLSGKNPAADAVWACVNAAKQTKTGLFDL